MEKFECPYCKEHFESRGVVFTQTHHTEEEKCYWKPKEKKENIVWDCEHCKLQFGKKYNGTHHSKETKCKFEKVVCVENVIKCVVEPGVEEIYVESYSLSEITD
jgi:hypothetical protein